MRERDCVELQCAPHSSIFLQSFYLRCSVFDQGYDYCRKQLSNGAVELSSIQIDKENGQVRVWPVGEAEPKADPTPDPKPVNPGSEDSDSRIKVCLSRALREKLNRAPGFDGQCLADN